MLFKQYSQNLNIQITSKYLERSEHYVYLLDVCEYMNKNTTYCYIMVIILVIKFIYF